MSLSRVEASRILRDALGGIHISDNDVIVWDGGYWRVKNLDEMEEDVESLVTTVDDQQSKIEELEARISALETS